MDDTLKILVEAGNSVKEISVSTKVSVPKIRKKLKELGLKTKWKGYLSQKQKFSDEEIISISKKSDSINQFLLNLGVNQTGGAWYHYQKRLKRLGIEFENPMAKGKERGGRISAVLRNEEALKKKERLPRPVLKKAMDLAGIPYICVNGHPPEWMGKKLKLHIHHKDEDKTNNGVFNLEYLCPNCHGVFHHEE